MNAGQLLLYSVISAGVGLVLTAAARLIDKWLPDPEGKHPLPPMPDLDHDGDPG